MWVYVLFFQVSVRNLHRCSGGGPPNPPVKILEVSAAEGRRKFFFNKGPPYDIFSRFRRTRKFWPKRPNSEGFGAETRLRGGLSAKNFGVGNIYDRSCVFKIVLFASPIPKIPSFLDSEAPPGQKLNVRLVSDVIRCSQRTY